MVFAQRREPEAEAAPDEEARLVERAKADPASFAPVYERYFPRVYTYCYRRLGHAQEAEDVASLIFTRALAGIGGYRGGSVGAWIFKIAHNAVANQLRSRRPQVSFEVMAEPESEEGPLDRLIELEARKRVERLIAALPEEQRELLALSVAGELSAREIGQVIGKREGAVRMALHRVIRQLRASYYQEEGKG